MYVLNHAMGKLHSMRSHGPESVLTHLTSLHANQWELQLYTSALKLYDEMMGHISA